VLENAAAALANGKVRAFGSDSPVALFALVTLQPEQGGAESHYLVVPAAGGMRVPIGAAVVTTVTPDAPLGRALVGAYEGDEINVQSPQGPRAMEIVRVE
jgi:transcription elongation GreA/GreB family factor